MPNELDEVAKRTAAALAYICANVEQLREDLRGGAGGDDAPLEQLLAALGDGGDLAGPLDRLHARLQADGDAVGIYGHTGDGAATRGLSPAGIGGVGLPGPAEIVYLCPAARCVRFEWPRTAAPVPRCRISGESLRRERL